MGCFACRVLLQLLPVLLLGVIGGLLGTFFISLNARLVAWRRQHLLPHGSKARVAEALLISLLTSAVSFLLPLLFACQASGEAGVSGGCGCVCALLSKSVRAPHLGSYRFSCTKSL